MMKTSLRKTAEQSLKVYSNILCFLSFLLVIQMLIIIFLKWHVMISVRETVGVVMPEKT